MVKPHKDSAQVKFPPPLAVLIVAVGAFVLRFAYPAEFLQEDHRWALGLAFILLGIFLMIYCVGLFRKAKTGLPPWVPTLVIVKEGPYRYSRNPIYLAFLLFGIGWVCLANNAVAFGLVGLLFLFLDRYVVQKEEAYLKAKFPNQYPNYLNSTRRWV